MSGRTGVETARAVADAVLYEGYQPFPYLSGGPTQEAREACGQVGVLAPPAFAAGVGEHSSCHAECLFEHEPGRGAGLVTDVDHQADLGVLRVRVRFRRLVDRSVWAGRRGGLAPVDAVRDPHGELRAWRESAPCEQDVLVPLTDLLGTPGDPDPDPAPRTIPLVAPAGREVLLTATPFAAPPPGGAWHPGAASQSSSAGEALVASGRVVRAWHRLDAELCLSARWLPGPFRVARLYAELRNTSPWSPGPTTDGLAAPGATERAAARDEALRRSLLAAHLVLYAPGWRFLSLTDPPWWAVTFTACCHNERAWPVLVSGDDHCHDDTVLAAPVVLTDHPRATPGVVR
ncbi:MULTISPECIES: hypothetical protein [Pseudofrankia]|uniref:hypothetical protein n=1 Tax=Pseudofrankia TaxID=2994363 RepID=UPI000234BD5F|nr:MULTISPECIES: hypothetical protein [Pseudofrankia]OHV37017.1 hypothetical protein BCD49_17415 [Pseudofrankia sp. EUN1h]